MKIAVIDIGSNSVRLMLWADGKALYKRLETTRLGAGLESGVLSEQSMARSLSAITKFCREAQQVGADMVCAFATAAVRTAKNGGAFCEEIEHACGLKVDVVSGEHEALLGLYGALGESDGGMVDIGGASTEICFRKAGEIIFSESLEVGAVRLYDSCHDDRACLDEMIDNALKPLDGIKAEEIKLYAVGGTASALAQIKLESNVYDPELVQNLALSQKWVAETADKLLGMTVGERLSVAGMQQPRADILAGGAYLLGKILQKLSCAEILFSDCDNLEGYLIYKGLA
ncbi:MAG: hypothetical protein K2N84_03660 [Clostridia bacterium]|nr:hypothetical protein [Clostridia bacterium]